MKATRTLPAGLLLVASLCATGCLARQATRDGDTLREVLVTMYTDQAMDNLIRAHDNLGFVQMTFHDLLNDDEDTYTGSAKATQTITQTGPQAVAVLSGFTRELINFWTLNGNSQRQRQMWFYAEPVVSQNDVYEAYLGFAQDPNLFRKAKEPPPACAAHIVRKCGGYYYWVPAEAGPAFMSLALRTSVMREGADTITSYYDRTIVQVDNIKKLADEGFSADISFAKGSEIPNGNGTMVVMLDKHHKAVVRVLANRPPSMDAVKEGQPTLKLSVQVMKGVPLTIDNLQAAKVRIYSDFYPPEAPTPPIDLNPIMRSLDRIRQSSPANTSTP